MDRRNKLMILGVSVGAILLIVFGIAYAAYDYVQTGDISSSLVAGDIYMHYKETSNVINIENAIPTKTYDPNEYFEFTIDGKNTYSEDIWYEVVLNYGEQPVGRTTRLRDELLRFTLTETIGNVTKTVVDEATYEDFSEGVKIWVNTVPANTNDEIEITYKLYVWITEETYIGDEGTEGIDYSIDDWNNNVYASIRIDVNGDFEEKKLTSDNAVEVIKNTLGDESGKGIIAVTNDNRKVDNTEDLKNELENNNIREYRYSGSSSSVNNYVYFNCQDDYTKETAKEKCERWRIIGIFKETLDDGSEEEYVKITRSSSLEKLFPLEYKINNTIYKIQTMSGDKYAYWNYVNKDPEYSSDWTTAGLQYWLNTEQDETTPEPNKGYLSYLSDNAKALLRETKYYLGNVGDYYSGTTAITAYESERKSAICDESLKSYSNKEDCYVWYGNQATWSGVVALMYPSDFGYSSSSEYWNNSELYKYSIEGVSPTDSWLLPINFWFLSPSSQGSKCTTFGNGKSMASNCQLDSTFLYVRPVVALKADSIITSGDGSYNFPLLLEQDN